MSVWTVTVKLEREDVLILRGILENPPLGVDVESVEQLLRRLDRIWKRKEQDVSHSV